MGEVKDTEVYEEELLDYEEEDEKAPDSVDGKAGGETVKKGYVGIHSSGFRDFLLKPELLRAIVDSGFEHPSEVYRQAEDMNHKVVICSQAEDMNHEWKLIYARNLDDLQLQPFATIF